MSGDGHTIGSRTPPTPGITQSKLSKRSSSRSWFRTKAKPTLGHVVSHLHIQGHLWQLSLLGSNRDQRRVASRHAPTAVAESGPPWLARASPAADARGGPGSSAPGRHHCPVGSRRSDSEKVGCYANDRLRKVVAWTPTSTGNSRDKSRGTPGYRRAAPGCRATRARCGVRNRTQFLRRTSTCGGKDPVHCRGSLLHHRSDLFAVDRLRDRCAAVADNPGDVFERHAGCG